jgi:hypothetical protein
LGWFISFGYLTLVGLGAIAALGVLFTRGPGGWWEIGWLIVTPMIFPCAVCVLAAPVEKGRFAVARWAGVVVGVLVLAGLVLVGLGVGDWLGSEPWRAASSISIWALAMVVGLWVMLRSLPPALRWIRLVAVLLGIVAAGGWIVEISRLYGGELQSLILAPTLIIIALVLALPALLWLASAQAAVWQQAQRAALSVVCPRCARMQQLRCPGGACQGCGLMIRVDVEEPRCACGYLLFGIDSDACPECGRNVRGKCWPAAPPLAIDAV